MIGYRFVLLLLMLFPMKSVADTLTIHKVIPVSSNILEVDEMGNAYVVRNGNTLLRLTPQGDSSAFYKGVQNGVIEGIDVTNPLRIVVYYPRQSKIVLLDRMLTVKSEIDLRRQGLAQVPVVASSADGNLWVYDQFNVRIKKIDENGKVVSESNDFRLETDEVPVPTFLIERNWQLYMGDTVHGIYTMDRYGSYISALTLYPRKKIQIADKKLIWYEADALHSWDEQTLKMDEVELPQTGSPIINAAINRKTIYVLYGDKLVLYKME